ncbi:hypothetical protein HPB50_027877 [Hyalomma asiaticum]|nr:hypothetical protein HPB50_027877 [Hyalomma asiaticum]
MNLVTPPGEAREDVLRVPSILAIEAMLPKDVDIVVKPWTKVEGLTCDSYTEHRAKLFPTVDGEFLVLVSVDENHYQSNTRPLSCGMLGGVHLTAIGSRYTAYWTRLFKEATCDSLIREAFEDTRRNPRQTPGTSARGEPRNCEVAQASVDIREYAGVPRPDRRQFGGGSTEMAR